MSGLEIVAAVGVGIGVGAFSAALGVGGGLLMVPFMVLVLNFPQQVAEGTSLLVIIPTAIAGVASHARRDLVDFRAAATLAALGVIGAVVGSQLALAIDAEQLKRFFGVIVVLVGLDMIRRGATRSPEAE